MNRWLEGILRSTIGDTPNGQTQPIGVSPSGSIYSILTGTSSSGDEAGLEFYTPSFVITEEQFNEGLKTVSLSYGKDPISGALVAISQAATQAASTDTPDRPITTDAFMQVIAGLQHEWVTGSGWEKKSINVVPVETTATVSAASSQLLAANNNRNTLIIQNQDADESVYISLSGNNASNTPSLILGPGESCTFGNGTASRTAINAARVGTVDLDVYVYESSV